MVQKFANLKLEVENSTVNASTIVQAIESLNADFINLQEEWITLSDDDQMVNEQKFLQAQSDFHSVGSTMLDKAEAVKMPPLPPASEAEKAVINQLQFGDPIVASSADVAATTITTTAVTAPIASVVAGQIAAITTPITSTVVGESEAMDVDASATSQSNDTPKVQSNDSSEAHKPVISKEKLATAITEVKESEQPSECLSANSNTSKLIDIMQLSFEEYADLLKPVIGLPLIIEVDVASIDKVIDAIANITAVAAKKGIKMLQAVNRTVIVVVISKIDKASQLAWKYEIGRQEPTFDFLIEFLCKRKKDDDVKIGASAAVQNFKIPSKKSKEQPAHGGACGSGSMVKSKKSGGSARTVTPSPQRNPNKKPKKNETPFCPLCPNRDDHNIRGCGKFMRMSLEDREGVLYRHNMCINCFSFTHTVQMCLDGPCKTCKKRHNSLIHHR